MFNTPQELIEDIRLGKIVILVDDEDRENEGDLVMASQHVTPEAINFMAKEARGLICLTMTEDQVQRLQLPMMVRDDLNFSPHQTAFTVSIEASSGVSTGISAADRAHTIRVASSPAAKPADIQIPGHIFPLKAKNGGVLKRAGHTEGSVDLARMAGLNPSAVICEVMNDDGTMARVDDLKQFAQKHQLKIGTIVDLIEYRLANDSLIELISDVQLDSSFGENMSLKVFRSKVDQLEHIVFQKGEIRPEISTLVRVHSENSIKDFLGTIHDPLPDWKRSMELIKNSEAGVFIYLRKPHGNQVSQELQFLLQKMTEGDSLHQFKTNEREYGIGAQILRSLGVHKMKLLTHRPDRKVSLKAFDLEITESVSLD